MLSKENYKSTTNLGTKRAIFEEKLTASTNPFPCSQIAGYKERATGARWYLLPRNSVPITTYRSAHLFSFSLPSLGQTTSISCGRTFLFVFLEMACDFVSVEKILIETFRLKCIKF